MIDTLRMEVVRALTVRLTLVLTVVGVGLVVAVAFLAAVVTGPGTLRPGTTTAALTGGGDLAPMIPLGLVAGLLAALLVGHDHRYGLIRLAFTAQPRRSRLMAARLLVVGGLTLATAVVSTVLAAATCLLAGARPTVDAATVRVLAGYAAVTVLWSWLGAGLAWLTRHSAAAVAVLIGTPLVVEPAVSLLSLSDEFAWAERAVPWLPFVAARAALDREPFPHGQVIGSLAGMATFAGVTFVVLLAAWWATLRRDA